MGLLFAGILIAAPAIEAWTRICFDGSEPPQPPKNPTTGQLDGSGEIVEDGEE